ncbi:MAG: transcriptional activator NhaR [Thermodesulfobacteriota bacterium]|nr:transcriptional activator NhaR [Thermodesulfobacteriota bacterium]
MEWLNYHHLLYFWAVMREGSMTAACEKLRLSPSTVSAQVGKLEETLGGKLFRRTGRRLEPTDLGQLVFRYADEIFSLGREMMDTVRGRPMVGPLSLKAGVVDAFPKLIARRILEPALSLSEPVHLVCYENKLERLLADLAMHHLDIVLSDAPIRKGLSIKVYNHFLGECGVTFFAVRRLAKELRPQFPESLDGAPMLLPLAMTALREELERWFASRRLKPMIVGEFEDSALLKAFGQHGDGAFAVPSVIEKEVQRQHNVEVVGRAEKVRERFYAITFERIIKHPAVTAISKAARKYLSGGEEPSPHENHP